MRTLHTAFGFGRGNRWWCLLLRFHARLECPVEERVHDGLVPGQPGNDLAVGVEEREVAAHLLFGDLAHLERDLDAFGWEGGPELPVGGRVAGQRDAAALLVAPEARHLESRIE